MVDRPKLEDWAPSPNESYPKEQLPLEWTEMEDDLEHVLRYLFSEIDKLRESSDPSRFLYHYTDGRALWNIVENRQIWLSDYRYTNDSLEGEVSKQLFLETLKKLLDREISDQLDVWLARTTKNYSAVPHWQPTFFLGCFSETPDSLLQWLGYGNSGKGYEIEIASESLRQPAATESLFQYVQTELGGIRPPGKITPKLIKVIYDPSAQRTITEAFCRELFAAAVKWLSIFSINEEAVKRFLPKLFGLCESVWRRLGPHFKDRAFETEQEWRCVVEVEDATKMFCHPYVRRGEDLFVPYVQAPITLMGIRSGPKADFANLKSVYSGRAVHKKYGPGKMLNLRASLQPLK